MRNSTLLRSGLLKGAAMLFMLAFFYSKATAQIGGTPTVCENATTPLTDPNDGGTWTTDDGAIALVGTDGTVTGMSAGTTTISYNYIDLSSMPQSDWVVVTVNPAPTGVSALASANPACEGDNLTLTGAATGAVTFAWAAPEGTAINSPSSMSTDITGVVTGNSGVYTLTATTSLSCSASASTDIVTVNALPTGVTASASPNPVCPGTNLSLTGAATGATTYSWASPGGTAVTSGTSLSAAVNGVVSGNAGVYTLTAVNGACTVTATTAIVTVNASPAPITGQASICAGAGGSITTLTPAILGGTWSSNIPSVADVGTDGVVTGANTGNTNITYVDPNGCSAVVVITVNPITQVILCSTSPSYTSCIGGTGTLTDVSVGGVWSSSDFHIAAFNGTDGVFTGVAVGSATVTYNIDYTGGAHCFQTRQVTVNPLPTSVTAAASPNPLCTGDNLTLTGSATGATTYTWTSPGGTLVTSATSLSAVVNGVAAGNAGVYTLTATNAGLCSITATTEIVTVNITPTGVTATASPNPLCEGDNLSLSGTATGAATYSWASPGGTSINSPASVSTSITDVVAGNNGIYTLTATSASSCLASATTSIVTVNPIPTGVTASAVAATNPVCEGGNITLTGSASGAATYSWAGPGGTAISDPTTTSASVTGVALANAGIYTFTATSAASCSAAGTTAVVTINPLPTGVTASASPNPACAGDNMTLTGAATGAATYSWAGPGGTAITAPSSLSTAVAGVVSGNGGIYTLTATTALSCATTATTSVVTINPLPTGVTASASPNPICEGDNITLTGAATGAATYSWAGPGGTGINAPTSMSTGVTGAALANGGIYTLTATTALSCSASATTSIVTINPLPTGVSASASPNPICAGDNMTLTGAATGAVTYSWAGPSGTAITAPSSLSTGVAGVVSGNGGIYTLTATTALSCHTSATTGIVTVNPLPTSVSASASPNPVCEADNLTLTGAATGAATFSWAGPGGTGINAPTSMSTGVTGAALANGGIYTLTATTALSCSASATTSIVTVNPLPTGVTASASPNPVCEADNLTLTGAATGAATFSWAGPGGTGIAAPTSMSTGVTGVALANGGIYTLTATTALSCHTSAITGIVTVNPLPTGVSASASPNPVCEADDLTLTGAATGAATYSWTKPGGTAITAPSSISTGITGVALANGGIYTLTATTALSCHTSATTAIVTVNPLPTGVTASASPNPVCEADNLTLTGAATGAATYSWAGPGGTSINAPTSMSTGITGVALANGGIYTLTATTALSCHTSATTGIVTVNPLPTGVSASASPNPVCEADNMTLTGAATGAATYSWAGPGGTAITAPSSMSTGITGVALANGGIYTLTATTALSCHTSATTGIVTVNPLPTGVTASASPNPVCEADNLTLTGAATGAATYSWAGPGGTSINAPTSMSTGITGVALANGGVYTLTATTALSCHTSATTGIVTVNPLPTGVSASASPNPICQGDDLTLTGAATGAATYSWTKPGGTAIAAPASLSTGITGVALANGGIYTLTATTALSCHTSATTAIVTVNPLPTGVTASASPNPVCEADNLTLTGAATGAATYSWASPGGTSINAPSSMSTDITGVALGNGGIYTLTATTALSCHTSATTAIVTVNPLPTGVSASASPNPVCEADNMTLTGAATGAATYSWAGPGGTAITAPSAMSTGVTGVALANGGIYTLTATTALSCHTSATTAIVTVNPIPTGVAASATPNPICQGDNLTLTGGASGAATYSWAAPGGTSINAPTSLSTDITGVALANGGIYTLTATTALSCHAAATTAIVTVNPLPTGVTASATPNPVCEADNLTLTGTATGAATYAWSGPGGTSITAPTALSTGVTGVALANAGVYTMTATTAHSCSVTTTTGIVTVNPIPTGVTASASPNPICATFDVTLTGTATGAATYSWASPGGVAINSPAALSTSITAVTVSNSGIYTLTATTSLSCHASATTNLTVNPMPGPITGTPNVCEASTRVLHNSVPGGLWTSSDALVASVGSSNGHVLGVNTGTINQAGSVTITYTLLPGGCYTTLLMTINPLAHAGVLSGNTNLTIGGTSQLVSTLPNGVWSSCNDNIATIGTDGTVTGIADGETVVTYKMTTVCSVDRKYATIRVGDCTTATNIATFAGTHIDGYTGDGGAATAADLGSAYHIIADGVGNVYIADYFNNVVRKVDPSGVITTFAGTHAAGYNGDGIAATSAQLNGPAGLTFDVSGNLYIADKLNDRIRKVDITTGIITTFAGNGFHGGWQGHSYGNGGQAINAGLDYPVSISMDCAGNTYIAEPGGMVVRKINASGIISIFAGTAGGGYNGDGIAATSAQVNNPMSVISDCAGNVYIGDSWNNRIRKVNASGIISTVAGNGTANTYAGDGGLATAASLWIPWGITLDACNNLYICDHNNNAVRKVDATTGIISTFAGNNTRGYDGDGGPATAAQIYLPNALAIDGLGNVYISDFGNHVIRIMGNLGYKQRAFANGTTSHMSICENQATPVNSFLAIPDSTSGRTDTWTLTGAPLHGTITGLTTSTLSKGTVSTPSGVIYTPAKGYTGTDEFTVRMSDGVSAASTTINIKVDSAANAGVITGGTAVADGGKVSLADPSGLPGGVWSSSDNTLATVDASGLVTGVSDGVVTISYTVTNACGANSATARIVTTGAGQAGARIVPNPNNGTFNCEFNSETDGEYQLTASDVTGRIVYRQTIQATTGANNVKVTLPVLVQKPSMVIISLTGKNVRYPNVKIVVTE